MELNKNILSVITLSIALTLLSCQTYRPSTIEIADHLLKKGLYKEASIAFKRATKKKQTPSAFKGLGESYLSLGSYTKAIAPLETARKYLTKDYSTHFMLGEAYRLSYRFSDATYFYQKAIRLNPGNPEPIKPLAWTYFQIRYYQKSIALASGLLNKFPNDSGAATILARSYLKLQQTDSAEKVVIESIKKANPQEIPYFHSLRGDIASARSNKKLAEKWYRQALRGNPLMASALIGLGKSLLESEKPSAGISLPEQGLAVNPRLSEAHYILGKAYETISPSKAKHHLATFLTQVSNDPDFLQLLPEVKTKLALLTHSPTKPATY